MRKKKKRVPEFLYFPQTLRCLGEKVPKVTFLDETWREVSLSLFYRCVVATKGPPSVLKVHTKDSACAIFKV